jgi:hypothetical protein
MTQTKPKRGRPSNGLVQYQLRLEPEIIQQLRVRFGKGKVSAFVRKAIIEKLKLCEWGGK